LAFLDELSKFLKDEVMPNKFVYDEFLKLYSGHHISPEALSQVCCTGVETKDNMYPHFQPQVSLTPDQKYTPMITTVKKSKTSIFLDRKPFTPQPGMPDYVPPYSTVAPSQLPSSDRDFIHKVPRVQPIRRSMFTLDRMPAAPQPGMPDYVPQSGILETCAKLDESYETLVASPLFDRVISLIRCDSPLASVAAFLATLLFTIFLRTVVLTSTFLLGALLGVSLTKRPTPYSGLRFSPQAGYLGPDDGHLFTGVKPKVKPKADPKKKDTQQKSQQEPPPAEYIPPYGSANFGGPAPPKKDPHRHDGPLNGFGVGI
jgi:hypothetical protein